MLLAKLLGSFDLIYKFSPKQHFGVSISLVSHVVEEYKD